jgi:hypothetical protein
MEILLDPDLLLENDLRQDDLSDVEAFLSLVRHPK